jgi:hypothetical protein
MADKDSGKRYEDDLRESAQFARDLKSELSNIDGISTSTQSKMEAIANSIETQTDYGAQLTDLIKKRNEFIEDEVKNGRIISELALEQLDYTIELVKLKKRQKTTQNTIKDGLKGAKDELLGSLGPAGQLVSSMLSAGGAVAIMVVVLTAALKFLIDMVKRGIELNQTLGMSAKDSAALEANIMGASYSMEGLLYSTDEMRKSAMALVETMGRVNVPSQLITDATRLTKLLGGDEASGVSLARSLESAGLNQTKLTDDIEAMATSMGMTAGPAMEMLVENQMKLGSLSHEQALAEAKKGLLIKQQGLDVKKINGMMREGLDIENSMRSAMKLRIMSGKEVNFNAINQAKLAGDGPALAKALNDQVKLLGPEFETNQRMQQVLADSLKVSVEDMNNMRNATAENAAAKAKEASLAAELVELQKTNKDATMDTLLAQKASTEETGAGIMAWAAGLPMWAKVTAAIVGIFAAIMLVSAAIPAVGAGITLISGAVGSGITVVGAAIGGALTAISIGLAALVVPGTAAIPIILAIGAAILMAAPAIWAFSKVIEALAPIITGIATVIGDVLMKAIDKLPEIITAVANGFVTMMGAISMESVGALFLLGPALLSAAVGMVGFGAATILFGGPAILGLLAIGGALALLAPNLEAFGNIFIGVFAAIPPIITAVADGLVNMMNAVTMENVGAMLLLGPALMGVAIGLLAIGTMGLPGLLALTGLGAVTVLLAPSLMGIADSIGDMMGGSDDTDTDDGNSALITEIKALGKELIGMRGDIQSQPILINVDGKVVSEMTKIQNRQSVSKNGYRK